MDISQSSPESNEKRPCCGLPDVGLLLIRLVLAGVFIYHGSDKLFNWSGQGGIAGFTQFLTGLKVPMPGVAAWVSAVTEFAGGILVGVGLAARLAAVPMALNMAVAVITVHWAHGFSNMKQGYEYPLTLGVVLAGLALTGPGRLALTPRL
jgi:putative oxidoreductase